MKKYLLPLFGMLLIVGCFNKSGHMDNLDLNNGLNSGDEVYTPYPTGASLVFYNQTNTSDTLKFVMPTASHYYYRQQIDSDHEQYGIHTEENYNSEINIPNNILDSNYYVSHSKIVFVLARTRTSGLTISIDFGNHFSTAIPSTLTKLNLQVGNKNYTDVYELINTEPNGILLASNKITILAKHYVKKIYYDLYKGVVKYEKYNGEVWLLKN